MDEIEKAIKDEQDEYRRQDEKDKILVIHESTFQRMENDLADYAARITKAERMNVRLVNTLRTIIDGQWRGSESEIFVDGKYRPAPGDERPEYLDDPKRLAAAALAFFHIDV